jgi:hypothetical protein
VIVDIFILFIHLLLNCYDKKAAKTNLDFVVYTCIVAGVTSGAGTANPSGAPEFTLGL